MQHTEVSELLEQYQVLEAQMKQQFHTSAYLSYYVISRMWLDLWKQKQTGVYTEKLPPINEDIAHRPSVVIKYEPLDTHMWNVVLKNGMCEGQHYEIITEDMWAILKKNNPRPDLTIQRDSYINSENRRVVMVDLMEVKFAPLFPSMAQKFRKSNMATLIEGYQYLPRRTKLKSFVDLLQRTLKTVQKFFFVNQNGVRLYKCPPEWTYDDLLKTIVDQVKKIKMTDDITFSLNECTYLDPEKYEYFEDCCIEPEQILIMDAKETHRNWLVKNPCFEDEGKCEGCYQFRVLKSVCECKKVAYCSEECRAKDEYHHLQRCEKLDSDEEKINSLITTSLSRNGICVIPYQQHIYIYNQGLRNLGNTCFMNSGVQCISNTWVLTDYFLSNKFKNEINIDNPLGSKGQLITKYSNLLKKLWFDVKPTIAPFSFKKAIGDLQPQFQGYQQHDSQELITFLLDGIHEDLNRVKVKPYVEVPDSEGRIEDSVAREVWGIFRQRNDSVIVDNMYGMYRSKIQCPTCDRVSVTFDPFLMVNVAIPQDNRKILKVQVVNTKAIWDSREEVYHYDKQQNLKLKDVLEDKGPEWLNTSSDSIVMSCSSTYNTDDVFLDELLQLLKKKLKYRKLFLRHMTSYEQSVPLDNRILIWVHNSWQQNTMSQWKKDLLEPGIHIFDRKVTFQDLHLELYRSHLSVISELEDYDPEWGTLEGEDLIKIYKNKILDKFYTLEFKSNQSYKQACSYCGKSSCNDCSIPFDEQMNLNQCIQDGERLFQPEIYIIWKTPFRENGRIEDLYDDWKKFRIMSNKQNEQATPMEKFQIEDEQPHPTTEILESNSGAIPLHNSVDQDLDLFNHQNHYNQPMTNMQTSQKKNKDISYTLQECLEFSQKPEKLQEDNTWYCRNCKDHVQAFKTMQVFMAPKILLFHLKRFKDSNKYFKSKLQTLVDFPLEGLDMTPYLLETRVPSQFENSTTYTSDTCIYDLYAVSNHFGGLGGGHYTAYCKNEHDGKWYNYDDAQVSEIHDLKNTIVGMQAYVLFYRKRN